ncbi:MAG: hypothetical protein IT457_06805 [Planctomycetes bacterium]|nr:hypothetical protein [Planctomycetota bacterium]
MNTGITIVVALALGCAASRAHSQDLGIKAPPQRRAVLIRGAELHVGDGRVLRDTSLWFDAGRIAGLGADERGAAADAEAIDGRGLQLWPGLIDAASLLGLNEIGSIGATADFDEIGDLTPEAIAATAVNPDATTLPVARSNGVLVVGVFPQGGGIAGHASVIQLDGWTSEDLAVKRVAGLVVEWPELPRREARAARPAQDGLRARALAARAAIDRAFREARAWLDARAADPRVAHDLRSAALEPALARQVPVFLRARGGEAIRSGLAWANGLGLRCVLVGGEGAQECLELIAQRAEGVIVGGTHRLPAHPDEPYDAPFTLPTRLAAAGIAFCIAGDGSHSNARNLPYHAATAIAFGLARDAAERAITSSAATLLGVGDELGTLAVGRRATLILVDGDPLELTSRVVAAWIDGRRIDLANKQTQLAEKYREKYRQLGIWPEPVVPADTPTRR